MVPFSPAQPDALPTFDGSILSGTIGCSSPSGTVSVAGSDD